MFYISKVGLKGKDDDSFIEFKKGLNIVYGSSNSGKSIIVECIDYAFGDKETNIEFNGYDTIYVTVSHPEGEVTFSRKIGEGNVTITSSNPKVQSGTYSIKKNSKKEDQAYVDDFLLKLMDMEPRKNIVVSKNWTKKNFTFRTCLNAFLIKQENIIRRESPYLPLENFAQPNFKSGLVYLWSGERFIDEDSPDDLKNARIRRNALEVYVTELLNEISGKKEELMAKASVDPKEMESKVSETIDLISANEQQLNQLFEQNIEINNKILLLDQEIAEENSLLTKYNSLNTQYEADAKRLEFIIEGEVHKQGFEKTTECPFCGGKLTKTIEESCVDAAHKELLKLAPKTKDLNETISDLKLSLQSLEKTRKMLVNQKKAVLDTINKEIKPLISDLKVQLNQFKEAIEDSNQAKLLLEQEEKFKEKLDSIKKEDKKEYETFDIMSKYQLINETLCIEYKRLLEKGNYAHHEEVVIDKFDYIIDGKQKRTQGQGYRAYLNSLAALALYNCLNNNGVYKYPFLIIDSPIQSLVENEDMEMEDSMKYGLFDCFNENTENKQIIIVENKFPKTIDYKDANIIYFTKDEATGRYGFVKNMKE